ncbi:MAG: discoidin domain-containing protein [Limnochordales bacterium]|nr:discoidin domain-containing protein [Limnochordales bacterium]
MKFRFGLLSAAAVGLLSALALGAGVTLAAEDLMTGVAPVALEVNWALADNGGVVVTDSNFSGYSAAPLNDGELNDQDENGRWAQVAWASAENPEDEHWIEIQLPGKKKIGGVTIFWARDRGKWWSSSNFVIQYWDGEKWVNIAKYMNDQETFNVYSTAFTFVPVETEKVRILQSPNGGPVARPGLMWVAEVQVWGAK